MTTETVQSASLAGALLEKLHAGWRRPDLSVDVQPFGEGVLMSITPTHMPGEYTYVIQRHLPASALRKLQRRGDLDALVTEILFDMDALPNTA